MQIDRDKFREVYADTPIVQYGDIFYNNPTSDKDYIDNYLSSKLWRLNNLYTIVNKDADRLKFNMRLSQHKAYAASLKHKRLIILKSRQQGISTLWLVSFFDDCIFNTDFSVGLMAQGTDEAELLLNKTKILWRELHPSIKSFMGIDTIKDNTKEFSFNNGSAIFIRTSFRSATLQRLHVSELAKIARNDPKRAHETKNGTLQAIAPGNTTIIESTAEGDNMYKQMWDAAVSYTGQLTGKDFVPVFLSWLEDPDCLLHEEQIKDFKTLKYFSDIEKQLGFKLSEEQKNFWVSQKRELGDMIYQEYPTTSQEAFMHTRQGTYYADLYLDLIRGSGRERPNLYDPNLPVQVAVDLGRNDFFVLIFFQTYSDGWRIISDYKNSGFGIKHYCEIIDHVKRELECDISYIILPHDAEVKDLTSDMTREEAFWKFGHKDTIVVDRTKDINNDRELVRQAMAEMFVDPTAEYTIQCFLNYSKEKDTVRDIWKDTHKHDKYSHGADALRQMVRGGKKYVTHNERRRLRLKQANLGMDV